MSRQVSFKRGVLALLLLLAIGSLAPGGLSALFRSASSLGVWAQGADLEIEEAFRGKLSGVFLTAKGQVLRILSDDKKGVPHQRFILRLPSGHTLLVLHNISVAPRVPLKEGIWLSVRGEYRWTEKGGLLHFTHRPTGRPQGGVGGWIVTEDGTLYR